MTINLNSEGEAYARRSIFVWRSKSNRFSHGAFILATGSTNQNRLKPYFELYDVYCFQSIRK